VRRLVVVITLTFAMLAAACGAERPVLESGSGVPREVTPGVPSEGAADGPSVSGSVGQQSERITVRLAVPVGWSLDPADAGPASISNRVMADLLFEGLTSLDASGAVVPGLAVRWDTSPDRLEWTFVLPAGLEDGEGRRVVAADVAASLNQVATRGQADQAATALTAVSGWTDVMSGSRTAVSGIKAVDDTTIRIDLDYPFELLLDVLASPAFGISIERPDGTIGTTGDFAPTADPTIFRSVSQDSAVEFVQLEEYDGDVTPVVANGLVDWAVVPPGDLIDDLPGDVIREPLDMRLGFVVRLADRDQRIAVGRLLDPVALADFVPGLSALATPPVDGPSVLPGHLIVDAPEGRVGDAATIAVEQLKSGGVDAELRLSSPAEFANRVVSGEANVFPVMITGGTGGGGATLRFFADGGVDDLVGDVLPDRSLLAGTITAAVDPLARAEAVKSLEKTVLDSGFVILVGRWEVTVAIGPRLSGLRQRVDGTLDLSRAAPA